MTIKELEDKREEASLEKRQASNELRLGTRKHSTRAFLAILERIELTSQRVKIYSLAIGRVALYD